MTETENEATVCVTGASGFIASWLVKRLLQRRYNVRAAVKNPDDPLKVKHLKNLENARTHLSLYKADLLDDGSYDAVIDGCVGVFHTASPVSVFTTADQQDNVIKPAVDGVLNVLRSCARSKTVKRVVFTGSLASAVVSKQPAPVEFNESYWTDIDACRDLKILGWSYFISKTLSEQKAWEFATKNGIDLITVLPPFVFGPFLTPFRAETIDLAISLHTRNKDVYGLLAQTCATHVDDVCSAHIYVFEHEKAEGRYLCVSHHFNIVQLANSLRLKYPEYDIPTQFEGLDEWVPLTTCSSKKLLDIGFKFKYDKMDIGDIVAESVECCREKGLLPPPAFKS